jgi:hypothetical protein
MGGTLMNEETTRARFERVRRERESRDRAIRIRKRYIDRTDYSGSELVSNIPAAFRDVERSAGLRSEKGERTRNL